MSTSLIGAFRQIRLNGAITTTTGGARMVVNNNVHMIVSDSGAFDTKIFNTGAAAITYIQNVSGVLAQQIAGSSAGVSAINGLSGALSLVGSGNIKIDINGQNIHIYDSGLANSGDLATLTNNLTQSGVSLRVYSNFLASGLSGTITQTGVDLRVYSNFLASGLSGALTQTGVALTNLIGNVSGALQTLINNADADVSSINGQSGIIQITGVGLVTVASGAPGLINVSVDTSSLATVANLTQTGVQLGSTIANTGQQLYNLTVGLSGTLTGYVEVSTERIVRTEIPTGVDSYLINWTPNYPSRPRLVQPTLEISTGVTTYFLVSNNITISGYTVLISDTVMETGVFVHTWAKL